MNDWKDYGEWLKNTLIICEKRVESYRRMLKEIFVNKQSSKILNQFKEILREDLNDEKKYRSDLLQKLNNWKRGRI